MFIISSAILIRMTAVYCHGIFLVSGRCKTLARLNGNQTMQSDFGRKKKKKFPEPKQHAAGYPQNSSATPEHNNRQH